MLPFDCTTLQPFAVFVVPFEFDGDPDTKTKRFIVALNVVEHKVIRFFKPTTKVARYDREPDSLKGIVEYRHGETCFEAERTIIEPKPYAMSYSEIQKFHARGEFEVIGYLPHDFRGRMNAAVVAKSEWRKSQKEEFFNWFQ